MKFEFFQLKNFFKKIFYFIYTEIHIKKIILKSF